MINLTKISFQNFQSYGSVLQEVDLTKPGTTMITGENLDDGGSNGAGKTTLINAISYALYDKPISDISKDGLINNINGKNMQVIIEFEKDKVRYKIRRYRKMKGNGVELYEDDKDITPDSIGNTNKLIEGILRMPYDLFVRVIVFSAPDVQFLRLPSRVQSDTLEELLDLTMLSEKANVLKDVVKDTTRSIELETNVIAKLNDGCSRFTDLLYKAHLRVIEWDNNNKKKIIGLQEELDELTVVDIDKQTATLKSIQYITDDILKLDDKINELSGIVIDYQDTEQSLKKSKKQSDTWIIDNSKLIKTAEDELAELKLIDLEGQLKLNSAVEITKDELTTQRTRLSVEESDKDDHTKTKTSNEKELEHLVEGNCPYCKQEFKETKNNIDSCNANIADANSEIDKCEKTISIIKADIPILQEEIDNITSGIQYDVDYLTGLTSKIELTEATITTLKNNENKYELLVVNLEERYDADALEVASNEMVQYTEERTTLRNEVTALSDSSLLSIADLEAHKQSILLLENNLKSAKDEHNNMLAPFDDMKNEKIDKTSDRTFINALADDCNLDVTDLPKLFELTEADDYVFVDKSDRLDKLHKQQDHQKFLLKLLTNKNSFIRKTMLSNSIPYLNKRLDCYLKEMGMPHNVIFTPKMEVGIAKLGHPLQIGNMSNGQQCRINLALCFAFRDVLQYLHSPINVWVLDEILDIGLCSLGIQNATNMIKRKAIDDGTSLFVISHREELKHSFDNNMVVTLSDGFSKIAE